MRIIAEVGGNHLGNFDHSFCLIQAALDAGATHVKFQCFEPEQMVGNPDYVLKDGPWKGRRLLELYQETHTPRGWFPYLFKYARDFGVTPFASVFHKDDIDFLETIGCPIYKISSFESNDFELIDYAAQTGKELIISTGACTDEEIWRLNDRYDATLLRCVSDYPAKPRQFGLCEDSFWDCIRWGLSDHTIGCGVAAAAVALGATTIEKHLIMDRKDGGPDAGFSSEPGEFKVMADACRHAYEAIQPTEKAEIIGREYRRSLWWAKDLRPGDIITRDDIKVARPADGLPPGAIDSVLGSMIVKPVKGGTPIKDAGRYYA